MAVGAGNINQRLISASDHFWAVSPEMLPLEIQKDFEWVKKALTEFPAVRDEGEIIATTRRKRTKTLVKLQSALYLLSLGYEHMWKKNKTLALTLGLPSDRSQQ